MTNVSGLVPANLMYDTLVIQRADFKHSRGWPSRGRCPPDGKTYTFKLKKNAKFHDGTPFNAQAVKYSMDRVTAPTAKANFTISSRRLRATQSGGR